MHKKCATCDILLDVPCANPSCAGNHNESLAEMCVYCATNERETWPFSVDVAQSLCFQLSR